MMAPLPPLGVGDIGAVGVAVNTDVDVNVGVGDSTGVKVNVGVGDSTGVEVNVGVGDSMGVDVCVAVGTCASHVYVATICPKTADSAAKSKTGGGVGKTLGS